MAKAATPPHLFRFGIFELDMRAEELRKRGVRLPIHGRALHVLAVLLESPGEVVKREELRHRIWPANTFVDFDHSVHNAIARLRETLGDSAETPRYIETLPRRGYRFIGQVEHAVTTLAAPTSEPQEGEPAPAGGGRPSRWLSIVMTVGVVITVAAVVGYWRSRRDSGPAQIKSLAVLPLENLSHDPEQEYFANGMTEALTTQLAQISALKVISHTSAMQYKGTKKSLPQIAQELGVDAVVEGAVQRSGEKVGITVQLIHAPSDRHLLAKSYERDLRDVLALQDEIAHTIADEIKAKLTPPEKIRLASARPINSEAYEDYLKGSFLLNAGQVKKGIPYFQGAIQKDPTYALAYAGLANDYISLGQPWGGDMSPKEVLPQAKAAARKALEIDDSLGEAHLALARIIQLYDWDWPAVEKEYRRALDLNPNNAMAYAWYGEYLQEMGRNEEAFAQMRQVMALDPLSSVGASELGYIFYTARQYDQAIRAFQKVLELEPDHVEAHVGLGWAYEEKKMYREAIAELEKATELSNRYELVVASLGKVLGESGRKQEAGKLLEELEERSKHHYISPCLIALVRIGLGEKDRAIASLEQGYTERDQWMLYLKVDPHMDDLRSDPRFTDLVRLVGIPN